MHKDRLKQYLEINSPKLSPEVEIYLDELMVIINELNEVLPMLFSRIPDIEERIEAEGEYIRKALKKFIPDNEELAKKFMFELTNQNIIVKTKLKLRNIRGTDLVRLTIMILREHQNSEIADLSEFSRRIMNAVELKNKYESNSFRTEYLHIKAGMEEGLIDLEDDNFVKLQRIQQSKLGKDFEKIVMNLL